MSNTSVYLPNAIYNFNPGDIITTWAVGSAGNTGSFDITTGVYTAPSTGIYEWTGRFQTGIIQPVLYINGAPISGLPCSVNMSAGATGCLVVGLRSTINGGINPDTGTPWSYLNINPPVSIGFATPTTGGIVYGLSDNNSGNNVSLGYGISTGGTQNVFIGNGAGQAFTTGGSNVLCGFGAGQSKTSLNESTGIGYFALVSGTGSYNTAVGFNALSSSNGVRNTAVGRYAAWQAYSGNYNTCLGGGAGQYLGDGSNCTLVGYQAGRANSGNQNTIIGCNSGAIGVVGVTGNNNTYLGDSAGQGITGGDNNIAIGYAAGVTGASNNTIYLGNTTNTVLNCPAANSLITSGSPLGIINNQIGILTPSYAVIGFPYPGTTGTIGMSGPVGTTGDGFNVITGTGVAPDTASVLQDFSYAASSGRLVYTGVTTRLFSVSGWCSLNVPAFSIIIFKNGSYVDYSSYSNGGPAYINTIISLATNDYVEMATGLTIASTPSTATMQSFQLMIYSIG